MTFGLVAVGIRSSVGDCCMEEARRCGEGEADGLRICTEIEDGEILSVVHSDALQGLVPG